jgi:glucosamine--fructose-6-phosphate aminotransferase (isomerizing)
MTHFEHEIREQPGVLAQLLQDPTVRDVAEELRTRAPRLITTLARGSSDNAVTFFGHLAAQTLGLPVASLPPSLLSVYAAPMQAEDTLAVGVSQSGESSDVVEGLRALRRAGALTVALSNDPESSLTDTADHSFCKGRGSSRRWQPARPSARRCCCWRCLSRTGERTRGCWKP